MIPVFLCPDNSGQTDDEKDMILQYKGWCNAYKQNYKKIKENAIIKPLLIAGETDEIVSTSTEHMGAGLESLTKNHKAIVGKASPSLF